METFENITNLREIRKKILIAQKRGSRSHNFVDLLAVSKTRPIKAILKAIEFGQSAFAENRVQEIISKADQLPKTLDWHFIGHLQKNKIRKILPVCGTIHSVDSLALAKQIARIANELELTPKIYLEVNISGDEAKFGFSPEGLKKEFDNLLDLKGIKILGLMTIPVFSPNPENSRKHFAALRELGHALAQEADIPMDGLSMGMSNDYEIAVEEGATVVRIGTEIFGKRTQK